jgi:methylmalonyl-CoA/ethylmalonyl-CoA epimerase
VHPAGGIHHVCLEVADVRQSLQALTPAGVRVLDPEPKIGAHGNPVRVVAAGLMRRQQGQAADHPDVFALQVVFLHPKDNDGVLMELEEVGHK